MGPTFAIGLDYGTNSVRALIVNVQTGEEVGTCVFPYPSGEQGILLDASDPDLARQHPGDYLLGAEASIRGALDRARGHPEFDPSRVIGIGVDTTGSTPLPVDAEGRPLGLSERFRNNLNAQAWLWKDHTAHRRGPRRLLKRPERCGRTTLPGTGGAIALSGSGQRCFTVFGWTRRSLRPPTRGWRSPIGFRRR
ncbi:MAG: hypothetical protein KatS3mg115_0940 [Candidatus Poribacteria bacterium]|nr:MAG: hypothetical protein KatS3mg115_0940 [Candidatus Poribacteria bacterium]